jgi:hypothetical protein
MMELYNKQGQRSADFRTGRRGDTMRGRQEEFADQKMLDYYNSKWDEDKELAKQYLAHGCTEQLDYMRAVTQRSD